MLINKAVLKTTNGTDENGRLCISDLAEIDCKIEMTQSLTINSQGQELVCSGCLYTEASIKTNDILEIKDKVYKVISVTPYYPLSSNICAINKVCFA